MRLHPQRLERMERWFQRRGPLAIICGRLIPGLRIPTTIIAGLSDISYRVYAPTAAIAAVIWSLFYFFVGALIQREWGVVTGVVTGLLDETSDYIVVIWILLILLSIGFGGWHVTRRVRRRRLRNHLHLPHHHHQRPRADALSEADGTGH
jgi:membrane protein DedA with SNARE-associated domain